MAERAAVATKVRRGGEVAFVGAILAAMAAVVLVGHDWGRPSVATAEQVLVERYLDPLRAAGLTVSVEQTCRYATVTDDEPWHLQVRVTVVADAATVADVLGGTIEVVRGPSSDGSWSLQDVRTDPQDGWGAGLREVSPTQTTLSGVYNNVEPDLGGNVGWQQVCQDGPRSAPLVPG